MKKSLMHIVSFCILTFCVFLPVYAGAVTGESLGLFPCNTAKNPQQCTFSDMIKVVNGAMKALFIAILIVAPLLIARAGYYYIVSADNPGERKKANNQLLNLVIGLVIVASAYVIVKLVLDVFINQTNIKVPF